MRAALIAIAAFCVTAPASAQSLFNAADMLETARPAIVQVEAMVRERSGLENLPPEMRRSFGALEERERQRERPLKPSKGNGVVFDAAQGLVMVLASTIEDGEEIEIVSANGEKRAAKLVGADEYSDIAVLKVENAAGLRAMPIRYANPRVGEPVILYGMAYGINTPLATSGIVAGLDVEFPGGTGKYMAMDLAVHEGHAGAPIFDRTGALVAFAGARYGPPIDPLRAFGIGRPAEEVMQIAGILARDGRVKRSWLGVFLIDRGREGGGVEVDRFEPNSLAEKAGMKRGDTILRINDMPVTSDLVIRDLVAKTPPGAVLRFTIKRDGREQVVDVTTTERPRE